MQDPLAQSRQLVKWWRTEVRPFLERHQASEKLESFETDISSLGALEISVEQELSVCFLGSAGVGKSTLINALVAGGEIILPAGGAGPLTAQALTVKHSDEPCFEVEYHPLGRLWQLVFGLKQIYRAELRAKPVQRSDDPVPIDEVSASEIDQSLSSDETRQKRSQEFHKTAQLLVTGDQGGQRSVDYILDRLYEAAGQLPIYGTTAEAEDGERIRKIREVLEIAKAGQIQVVRSASGDSAFRESLAAHATGFLAPLIKQLTVYWNGEALKDGLQLVDLPGIGIAGDVYREVTNTWIRERANAVILTVDRSGITEAAAELLRRTGYLNRLLYSADDPRGDPILMIAVVQIDNVAEENYSQDKSLKKAGHFSRVCDQFASKMRQQLREQLEAVWTPEPGVGKEKRKVIENILNTLQIHPVSAIQYRRCLRQDVDDPAFIKQPDQSRVPQLTASLQTLARQRHSERVAALGERVKLVHERIRAEVALIRAQWQQEDRAVHEAEKLREDVTVFLQPLREELRTRQGQYREFLKETVPQQIETLVLRAQDSARKAIVAYLRSLRDAHWATLKAAVTREGTFYGSRHINLPDDFGLKFEEPIAEVWGKEILTTVRKRTKAYADDCVDLVETVVTWAKEQGSRVQPSLLEAQRDAIRADAKALAAVGKEKVNELGEEVKNKLIKHIEGPIRKKCRSFVSRNAHIGSGVKSRILDLFSELAEEVTLAAAEPATAILTSLYHGVRREITASFEKWQDPLEAASEAIVTSQENFLRRSDAQRRGKILAESEEVLALCPELSEQGDSVLKSTENLIPAVRAASILS